MDKLKMRTPSIADENFAALAALFPNAVTETIDENGAVARAIDKDVLTQEINAHVVEGREERYQFTWPDKRKSISLANAPIAAALRPCREESVNFDTTENLYIEGDNLDVLKLLRETYLSRVKMIYIDPPYNTGNDFVYEDDFTEDADEFLRRDGQYDEQGNRLVPNVISNGRFHTDWLNMMYPRLRIARDLLTDDGVIFVSIDDNEVRNLRIVCDEIFGEKNFVANFIWRKKSTSTNVTNVLVSTLTDHILCYSKTDMPCLNRRRTSVENRNYPFKDAEGNYRTTIIEKKDAGSYARSSMKFPIMGITPREGKRWQIGEKTAHQYEAKNRFLVDGNIVKLKIYDFEDGDTFSANPNLLLEHGTTDSAGRAVNQGLFKTAELFSNPKPVELLKHLIELGTNKDDESIVLDFFSGSATTADAVMRLNAENGGNRRFIMVQLPELCDNKSEAYKTGYKNICEIGKERIRRAAQKIKDDASLTAQNLNIGFRVLKLDSSNMKDVYYTPNELAQMNFAFEGFIDNIKADRSPEDLLFQVMLELGISLSAKITQQGNLWYVNDTHLIACFDKVDTSLISDIAKKKPHYAVFRDSSFVNDSAIINFEQVFNTYSPNTIRMVL